MTQRQLSKKCGLSAGYIALLEKGVAEPPPLRTCKRLARALALNWEEVRQRAFATRLKTWLGREGYAGIAEGDLLDLIKRIEAVTR
jgi:transcriptional regulator with XRE-family HTH domain